MPKPENIDLTVIECPNCHKEEYYGMMYFINQKFLCRKCFKKITNNGEDINYFFPKWEDGIDYTKIQEDSNAN